MSPRWGWCGGHYSLAAGCALAEKRKDCWRRWYLFCLYGSRAHIRHAFPCVLYWCGLETAPSLKPHLLLTKEGGTTCGRPAGDPRKTRERPAKDPRKDVPIREAGKCTSVPAYQHFSKTYPCVRARVYLWKLPVRWYTGTLCLPILTLVKGAQGWRAEVPHKDFVGNVIT